MPRTPAPAPAGRTRRRVPRLLWAILLLGAVFRFWAVNWDQGTSSHPDERHVLMSAHKLGWPRSLGEYLDESRSPLNPRNSETPYFAYGTLPTTVLTGLCELTGIKRFEDQTLLGRSLSAVTDLGVVWLVFLLGRALRRDDEPAAERAGLLAALLYAAAVSPIQHAHFFVVDPFANFFVVLCLWLLARAQAEGRLADYAGAGLAAGLAVACKISVATLALPAALVALAPVGAAGAFPPLATALGRATVRGLIFLFPMALAFRLGLPDAFSGLVTFAPRWLGNMREVIGVSQGTVDIPFTRQWVDRTPLLFPWWNMVLWGLGLPLGLAAWACAAWAAWRLGRWRREWALLGPLAWIGTVFFYQGIQWQMTMRYFLPIYAPLCALAAWGLVRAAGLLAPWRWRWTPAGAVALATVLWAGAFLHVYTGGHTRVRASRWITKHIHPGAALGVEVWDDALPLALPGSPGPEIYRLVEFPWYDGDSPAKRENILGRLNQVDYLITASDKLYGSIPRMPWRYPMTTAYYRALFDGSLGFDLVADFRGRMSLLGWKFPTDAAEEAFSVYDHPRVMIFKKTKRYTAQSARALLGAVDLSHVSDTREPPGAAPRGAVSAPGTPLRTERAILLDDERWREQVAGGTWSDIFDRDGFVNRHAIPCWVGLLLLLLVVSFPYAYVVCGGLPDRGAGLGRLAAISVPLWLLWLLASGELAAFRARNWWIVLALFALGSAAIVRRRRADLADCLRREWRPLLAGELTFWLAFAACLTVRWFNPDLWHASWGGEKPMEMTYLYGVMKSDYFPPYNPWYEGGFINYYYFGFVLTGGLIKAMGVVPEVGFNLCLATFYALTAAAAFSVTRALAARCASLWPAVAGSAFVVLLGNLFQASFICQRFVDLGRPDHELTIPLVSNLIRAGYGLAHVWKGTAHLFVYAADPYWVAARAIPVEQRESVPPITEFPCWSYLYADLHPHVIALPFTLALIGVLAAWCRTTGVLSKAGLLAAMAFLLGMFWPTNTWDWPTYGALTGLTIFLTCWRQAPATPEGFALAAARAVGWFLPILVAGRLMFRPFFQHYVAGYGSFILWHGERTPFSSYLIIYGFFLFVLAAAFFARWWERPAEGALYVCHTWLYLLRQLLPGGRRLAGRELLTYFNERRSLALIAGVSFALAVGLTAWMVGGRSLPAFLCLGALLSLILAASRRDDPLACLPYLMTALAFGLSLAVEFVVLDGDVGRMNTVFKFYYQVWVLFALGAAALLVDVWRALPQWRLKWRAGWVTGFAALLLLALLYPATAVPAKVADRFVNIPPTLDGLAYMDKAQYDIQGRRFPLRGDLLAIRWLQDHVRGTPVLLEMNAGSQLYTLGNRYSIHTGLPSVVGWDWHQRQQQAGIADNKVAERISDVRALYATTDPRLTRILLEKYHIGLVVIGDLERAFAEGPGLRKFAALGLEQVYDAAGVTIYRVPPTLASAGPGLTAPPPVEIMAAR